MSVTRSHPEAEARAFAARLDVLFAEATEATEEALLAIGELLGGLSVHGYLADLMAHLDRVEEDLLMDAGPRDYRAGMGGNDPDGFLSSRLEDAIDAARAADAASWLRDAQALLHRMTQPLPVAA